MTTPSPYRAADLPPQGPPPRTMPVRRSNRLGIAALILGIASIPFAFLPIQGAYSLGAIGLIVGLIGLAQVSNPRRHSLLGTVLSSVSLIIAFSLVSAYSAGFTYGALGPRWIGDLRDQPTTEYIPPPDLPVGGPRPLGSEVELTDADGSSIFTASVTESVLNADDLVLAVADNSPAPAGMQWALVTIDLTLLAVSTLPPTGIYLSYIADGNEVYAASDPAAVVPGADLTTTESVLDLGESGTGQVAIAIPAERSGDGYWSIQYGHGTTGGALFYFETE